MPQIDYHERQAAKADRLRERAAKLQRLAAASQRTFETIHSAIPLGQPILVGHHSEKRHRRDLDRASRAFDRAREAEKRAQEISARAAGCEDRASGENVGPIMGDDPTAPEQLRAELAEVEALAERMKAANAAFRKAGKPAHDAPAEQWAPVFAVLFAGSTPEQLAIRTAKLLATRRNLYTWQHGCLFEPYQIAYKRANAKRIRERLAALERAAKIETREEEIRGVRVVHNAEENRLQLFFPERISKQGCSAVKSYGWKWSPSNGCWQRYLHTCGRTARYKSEEAIKAALGSEVSQ